MFESEFLTASETSRQAYARLIAELARTLCESLPSQPYCGTGPKALADIVGTDFLPSQSLTWDQIERTLKIVIANSVVISDVRAAAHLHCPPLIAALAAEAMISALNQSMDSFDQAPIATLVEQKLIAFLCSEAGLPGTSDGTFTAGGSQSNYMGLLLARDHALESRWKWSAQKSGLPAEARRLRILCSEVAHFTVEKSAAQLGLGTDAVIRVGVDGQFRMQPTSLQNAIENLKREGLFLMAVVATAGTTDFGSIDPLKEVIPIARQEGAWVHVDAAYGGGLLFSPTHRSKLEGIEYADSLTIDYHKLFWQPIPCSTLLVRDSRSFETIKLHADYLNPEDHEEEGIPNLVTTSLLTSRRFDALKLWISFQALGRENLAAMIEQTIRLANHTAKVVRATHGFELVCEPQLSTVVFRYVECNDVEADRINAEIRRRLFDRGLAVVGHTRVNGRQCLKFTCVNPTATESDMDKLLESIRSCGAEIVRSGNVECESNEIKKVRE